ncbi:MAG: heme o synthase [Candidatus Saccharimonadales bacterium]
METLEAYYWLAKPGIIYGNLLAAAAGFFVASRGGGLDAALLLGAAVGIALVIASACVANNYIDRDIDKAMARTRWRASAKGTISVGRGLGFAAILGLAGFIVLAYFTNLTTFVVGAVGFIDYVVLYTWAKRHSWHGTLVGSISGSAPLAGGYTAVAGRFDTGALLLFILMACWQMPHFYAIAIRRLKDYKAAGLPVLPAVKGMYATKLQMIAYVAAFMVTDILLYALGYFGRLSTVVIGLYGAVWLSSAVRGLSARDDKLWAKKMFLYSLVFLPALFTVTAIDTWLG